VNLKAILQNLILFFEKQQIDHALIGAFALKAYGYVRATQDVDFLVRAEDQEEIISYVNSLGYETGYRSRGFSNHVHALPSLARIDFVYVEGETAQTIFSQARPILVLEGLSISVVKAEHLIALKVFAMKNDPERVMREMADLQQLLRLPGIDQEEVRQYFQRYDQLEKYHALVGGRKTDAGT
jgi:hypothetical protein